MPSGSGLVPDSAKLSGGSVPTVGGAGAGGAGAPGSAGASGLGSGMPPMMPPGSGQGLGKKERERTTWLNEDEKTWGVEEGPEMAVIGRPDENEDEFEDEAAEVPRRPGRGTSATRPTGPSPRDAGQEEATGGAGGSS
jgi:hypothetical protein